MPLGIDATLRYALNDFSKPLTEAQLRDHSPYNTRLRRGLPPTPISNPGLASIHAAVHPAHVSYLYYVAAADGCGEHVFTSSYAQFEHDAAAYREAVATNGGNVPSCKKEVMTRLGVLGWPVAHSRSPAMHNAALAASGCTSGATSACRCRLSCSTETTRALGGRRLSRRQRHDPAQAGCAVARG